jgi:hypothetical protein
MIDISNTFSDLKEGSDAIVVEWFEKMSSIAESFSDQNVKSAFISGQHRLYGAAKYIEEKRGEVQAAREKLAGRFDEFNIKVGKKVNKKAKHPSVTPERYQLLKSTLLKEFPLQSKTAYAEFCILYNRQVHPQTVTRYLNMAAVNQSKGIEPELCTPVAAIDIKPALLLLKSDAPLLPLNREYLRLRNFDFAKSGILIRRSARADSCPEFSVLPDESDLPEVSIVSLDPSVFLSPGEIDALSREPFASSVRPASVQESAVTTTRALAPPVTPTTNRPSEGNAAVPGLDPKDPASTGRSKRDHAKVDYSNAGASATSSKKRKQQKNTESSAGIAAGHENEEVRDKVERETRFLDITICSCQMPES